MDILFIVLEVLGSVAFAISGVMVARTNHMDVFGAAVLGCTTSCGGGLFRDLILGRIPPSMFVEPVYAEISLVVSLITFIIIHHMHPERILAGDVAVTFDNALNATDSIGLAAFVVVGYQAAEAAGYGANGFLCVFSGVITGIGGGVLRDILAGQMPLIMKKHVYGMAAVGGGLVYLWMRRAMCPYIPAVLGSMGITCLIRFLAIHYRWNLPRFK